MSRYISADQAAPARSWASVTPSDSVNLAPGCRGIYVTAAGNIALVGDNDVAVTFVVDANTFMPCGPKRVNSTNTTSTGIVALY